MSASFKKQCVTDWLKRGLDGLALVRAVLAPDTGLKVAVSSSFGAESAVLLDLIAQVDVTTPVLTVDTGQLFEETVAYRERLVDHFGLTDVRVLKAPEVLVEATDPDGLLHQSEPDMCCQVRKVMPHAEAAVGFDVLITGRKRFHGGLRGGLPSVHGEGPHIKVNPLVIHTESDIEAAFVDRGLPRHPLVAAGYRSIGCTVCTHKTTDCDGVRAGRWSGKSKTECGLHVATTQVYEVKTQETGL